MERREELGYPLGTVAAMPEAPPPVSSTGSLPSGAADFVLEVGCEELPPSDVTAAMQQLRCLNLQSSQPPDPEHNRSLAAGPNILCACLFHTHLIAK